MEGICVLYFVKKKTRIVAGEARLKMMLIISCDHVRCPLKSGVVMFKKHVYVRFIEMMYISADFLEFAEG